EPAINLSESTKKNEKNVSSKLALQIGVAGFAFGNIMLMSLPEYLNKGDVQLADFQTIFAAISIILTLPVLLFSATDYYKSAYKGLKSGYLNIDVPIVIGIFALIFQSLYEVFTKTGQGYFDSLAGLLFFLLVGKWFQQKTYQGLSFERDFKSYFPLAA